MRCFFFKVLKFFFLILEPFLLQFLVDIILYEGIVRNLLVIDDNEDICRVISDFLSDDDTDVITAFNGEDGLLKLKEKRFDLMILDYRLPGINGYDVFKKARMIQDSIITIMISAYRYEAVGYDINTLGIFDFLNKPFSINTLKNVVNKALNSSQEH
jgi:two-component system, NtrC family, response regulator HydG